MIPSNAAEAHVIASLFMVNYNHQSAGLVIRDLARLLGPEVVCLIARQYTQEVIDDNERIEKMLAGRLLFEAWYE